MAEIEKLHTAGGAKYSFSECPKAGPKFGAEVAIIAVSEANKVYSFGSPSVNSVVSRYPSHKARNPEQNLLHDDQTSSGQDGNMSENKSDDEMHLDLSLSISSAEEKDGYRPVQEKLSENNTDMEKQEQGRIVKVQIYELDELMAEMEEIKKGVEDRAYY